MKLSPDESKHWRWAIFADGRKAPFTLHRKIFKSTFLETLWIVQTVWLEPMHSKHEWKFWILCKLVLPNDMLHQSWFNEYGQQPKGRYFDCGVSEFYSRCQPIIKSIHLSENEFCKIVFAPLSAELYNLPKKGFSVPRSSSGGDEIADTRLDPTFRKKHWSYKHFSLRWNPKNSNNNFFSSNPWCSRASGVWLFFNGGGENVWEKII